MRSMRKRLLQPQVIRFILPGSGSSGDGGSSSSVAGSQAARQAEVCCSQVLWLCVDTIVHHAPFKVHVGQGRPLLLVQVHIPTRPTPDATVSVSYGQDPAIGFIGLLPQALAGQLVLSLRVPAEERHTAKGHRAITAPVCLKQAWCLLIIQPMCLGTLLIRVPGTGPQKCHDVHELGPMHITGLA